MGSENLPLAGTVAVAQTGRVEATGKGCATLSRRHPGATRAEEEQREIVPIQPTELARHLNGPLARLPSWPVIPAEAGMTSWKENDVERGERCRERAVFTACGGSFREISQSSNSLLQGPLSAALQRCRASCDQDDHPRGVSRKVVPLEQFRAKITPKSDTIAHYSGDNCPSSRQRLGPHRARLFRAPPQVGGKQSGLVR